MKEFKLLNHIGDDLRLLLKQTPMGARYLYLICDIKKTRIAIHEDEIDSLIEELKKGKEWINTKEECAYK